ncbi:MAG TPA: glycosyltransferase [Vicinamibacterales bacterium]|nr:glycosyltransferase [Vicinamibacterales bacterium]
MSRIVLSCWGSYGDLFPYLGLAVELKARGHVPVIATCPIYRELVEAEGFEFQPVRPDIDPQDSEVIRRVMDPVKGSEVVINELIAPYVRDAYADLQEATRGADLVLSHPATVATPIVATERKLRWLSTVLSPVSFFSTYDFPVLPPYAFLGSVTRSSRFAARAFLSIARRITGRWTAPVRAFRAERGLPDVGDPLYEGQFSPMGTLALFSPVLAQPQPDWPTTPVVTGFPFFNRAIPMPEGLVDFLDRGDPPIVFTLGSAASGAPGAFYDESVKAAALLGRRAVFLVSKYAPVLSQSTLPAGMIVVEFAPHDTLFPRAAATVHHGGIGTTGQALRSGKPMLVVPHAHDQPDNAARAARLGVARVLDAQKYTADRAAAHLRALLDEPSYRTRADEVGHTVRAENGAKVACDAIEANLGTPEPRNPGTTTIKR